MGFWGIVLKVIEKSRIYFGWGAFIFFLSQAGLVSALSPGRNSLEFHVEAQKLSSSLLHIRVEDPQDKPQNCDYVLQSFSFSHNKRIQLYFESVPCFSDVLGKGSGDFYWILPEYARGSYSLDLQINDKSVGELQLELESVTLKDLHQEVPNQKDLGVP